MALSGLAIFKLLPKTNCGDCGVPTCMAFAMKLAQKKAELSQCPHVSEEAKSALGADSEPPIRLIKIGNEKPLEIGNEIVMFRHEKTFYHQSGIGIQLKSSADPESILTIIKDIESYKVERIGESLSPDLFYLKHDSPEKGNFLKIIEMVKSNSTKGIILDCQDKILLKESLEILKSDNPAIYLNDTVSENDIELAKNYRLSLILTSDSLEDLSAQSEKVKAAGVKEIILNLRSTNIGKQITNNTILRRSALRKNYKPFGYPLFTYIDSNDPADIIAKATVNLCKYASIIILPEYDKALLYTLFTLRQNIYTDPQKPIQVDPKIYAIGEPTPESPLFVTTNFSLTYFIVAGEIENSGTSAYLAVCDVEGQSVLTAWAAGKFIGPKIAKFLKDSNVEQITNTRKIIIPGFVSQISGELEENMPGWQVIVGCQEASDIPTFVKNILKV
jgi:acetyl-CoA decarbonylase/synthase, CODH/ACS complex subunit gamma